MKHNQRRELFVVSAGKDHFRPDVEEELKWLHDLLNSVENDDQLCTAHEVIDLNSYHIISHPERIKKFLHKKETDPFIFLSNKN